MTGCCRSMIRDTSYPASCILYPASRILSLVDRITNFRDLSTSRKKEYHPPRNVWHRSLLYSQHYTFFFLSKASLTWSTENLLTRLSRSPRARIGYLGFRGSTLIITYLLPLLMNSCFRISAGSPLYSANNTAILCSKFSA